MELIVKRFDELTNEELYKIIKARIAVFVVEQNCPYMELDDKDKDAYHVYYEENGEILAYLRVLDKKVSFETPAIGRVITLRRSAGLGRAILKEGIRIAKEKFEARAITIEAQVYAIGYYEKEGFVQSSEEFLEDGILHIEMILNLEGRN